MKNLKMMAKLLQTSPIEQKEPPKVNKTFRSLVPVKLWALYDGVAPLFVKINLYSNPSKISYWKIFYSISKCEVAKAFIQKKNYPI